MKKLLLTIILSLGLINAASAFEPLTVFAAYTIMGGSLVYSGSQIGKPVDSRLFKTVTAHHTGNNGYSFDITQFEYDSNPGKFVLDK